MNKLFDFLVNLIIGAGVIYILCSVLLGVLILIGASAMWMFHVYAGCSIAILVVGGILYIVGSRLKKDN